MESESNVVEETQRKALALALPPYCPPLFMSNGHVQSVFPSLFRRVPQPRYERERMTLSDGDYVDVDWARSGYDRIVVLSHGLCGHSHRAYITGMVRALAATGWDAVAWNFRGCGGTIPSRPIFTHNGSSDDLAGVVENVRQRGQYRSIALVGFSMGGNLTLLYLGRGAKSIPAEVCGAVAFSAPCDLCGSAEMIKRTGNRIYLNRFLRELRVSLECMAAKFPDVISLRGYEEIRDFYDFDTRYTAPLHGFRDAVDYWTRSSSRNVIESIARPTWIISAKNDPFLSASCFPEKEVAANPWVQLAAPVSGGHCGFIAFNQGGCYWSEAIACQALDTADQNSKN